MANSLGEDLTGKVLEVKANMSKPEYQDLKLRLVRAEAGFGCSPGTIGTAVLVTWLADGEKDRLGGYDFERIVPEDEAKRALVDETAVWQFLRDQRDASGIVAPLPDHLSDDDITRYLEANEEDDDG